MIPLTLAEVAEAADGRLLRGASDTTVTAVTTDSREVPDEATLFVAIRGEHADGHDYVDDALRRGAVAVLADRDLELHGAGLLRVEDTWRGIGALGAEVRRRVDPTVVAITGSVGKTTTKDLTAAALGAGRRTVAAQGSYNNELGVPLTLLTAEADTEALVVEIGARGVGHIARLTPLVAPDVSIVTAVAGVHLELFGDVETVAVAKGELVECLSPSGTAVLNADDPRVAAMARRTDASVLRYGIAGAERGDTLPLELEASQVRLDRLARASFHARTPWGETDVTLPLAGRHHVGNALAALAAAGSAGVAITDAAAAIAGAPVSSWRGEVIEAGGLVVLNDAYNANPTSMAAALEMLGSVERHGRAIAVLGVMAEIGTDHELEHETLGRAAVDAGVDLLVVVGEEAAGIARGAREAGSDEEQLASVPDAEAALRLLRGRVVAEDVVLVKASRVAGLEAVADGLAADAREGRLT